MEGHDSPINCGHTPVSMYDYSMSCLYSQIEELEKHKIYYDKIFQKSIVIDQDEYSAKCIKINKLVAALEKIADPRKRDHTEPDAYTELGCVMNIADEALKEWNNG